MYRSTYKVIFVTLYIAMFLGAMWLITGFEWSPVWFGAPIILAAEAIFFGMLYLNLAQDGLPEQEVRDDAAAQHPHRVNWHTMKPA